ncbi:rab proteins geranylgeranyltransferase component A-like isoform X1 [Acropora millepora]|uniref:rab proteins geranylgeranyltransferase component A-like isoform X1 n=2 Tax=Acropora millepora TaxID=45264 RepID=UPI001CF51016|nr:rab proteins geranylgeranyltransferase component A-like isoform X1 [Acropora millepora]
MAEDDLPEDYDVIVLGTGFPESVVAAALSRVGMKVLHLDRNDYYSDQWATFTFDSLVKWIDHNQTNSQADMEESEDKQATNENLNLESGTYTVAVPSRLHEIKNVVVKSYFCEKLQGDSSNVEEPKMCMESAAISEAATNSTEPQDKENEEQKDASGTSQKNLNDNNKDGSGATLVKAEDTSGCAVESEMDNDNPTGTVVSEDKNGEVTDRNTDSDGSVQSSTFPGRRVRNETKPAIGLGMTYNELKPHWRRFNIDLSPKLLFSRGSLVEALISANISHYLEFKSVTRMLTYMDGRVEEVPCSRADVFSSSVISIVEKRMLMKFLTFCLDFEQQQDQYEEFEEKPYYEFLQSRRLTPNLQHFIIHAIAMVKAETSTVEGLKATQRFLQSLGRYGNTPFIWPLYGAGELPQAFCRMCAVFGGLYCLRREVSAIAISPEPKQCTGIISNNKFLKCKWLVTGHSYVPESFQKECLQFVSRAVFITCGSVKPSDEEFITVLSMPPSCKGAEPVRVIELGPSAMACPKGLYVVHLISKSLSSAMEDLKPTAEKLFHIRSGDEGDVASDKPTVLWSLYFNQAISDSSCVADLPSNMHVLDMPGVTIGFGEALQQAKEVFEKICPGEEFLQRVPNPEDIILDGILQDGNQNVVEPAGEVAQAGETEHDCHNDEKQASEAGPDEKERNEASNSEADTETQGHSSGDAEQNLEIAEAKE